jgi:diadenylate cyclase
LQEILDAVAALGTQSLLRVIEFAVVWFVVYRLLLLIRGTRAWPIMWGLLVFALTYALSAYLKMETLRFLLEKATLVGGVALVVLFFPELRQALEQFGSVAPWAQARFWSATQTRHDTIDEIVAAVSEMAAQRTGALIVVERTSQLPDVITTGVTLEARVSAPVLSSLFYGGNPLHDGAVIVRGDKIVAAACELPMPSSQGHMEYHMRHRAAIGVTEESDAISVVVSEETGRISVADHGVLELGLTPAGLRTCLRTRLRPEPTMSRLLGIRLRSARRRLLRKGAAPEAARKEGPQPAADPAPPSPTPDATPEGAEK